MPPAPNSAPTTDTVSQSEIERLLAQVGGGEMPSTEPGAARAQAAQGNDFLQRHDFPQLSFFSTAELRKLRMRHEEFINSLAARLSIRFGMEVALQMSKLETAPFQAFVDGLANPTHLTVLKLEPLLGNCLMDIPLRLGLCLVDRELGGAGVWPDEPRELTKMETGLLSRVVENILSEWCGVWGDLLDLRPVLIGCESNGRFLQTCPPNTMLLVLGMEFQMGAVIEQMQLALPYPTLEPLMARLNALMEGGQKPAVARAIKPLKWNPVLDDMELRVTAELPEVEVSARQLADLKPGDIIPIPIAKASQVRVYLGETSKFTAVLGTSNEHWAVRIVQVHQTQF
jgi:flagellar motor switch protein FliM